jgi:large subunit ribosomal protein L13
MQRQTTLVKPAEASKKVWYLVDAKDKPMGRVASEVAMILMGKNKVNYTPNVDCGDFVIVINAKHVAFTGDKLNQKKYYNVSTYNGGLRTRTANEMIERFPEELVRRTVWGMLPKGRLGRQMIGKLFVYPEEKHEQGAQNPVVYEFRYLGGNK